MLFKILWCIDALSTLVILYFLFVGLADGTVNERNMGIWLLLVTVCASVLGGSYWLRTHQHPSLAVVVTAILALPAFAYIAFFLIAINSKWQ